MKDKYEILVPESTYHVYNRANGNEKLFLSADNYRYFLKKYEEHISPIADTFCYCLMPNHFHLLIRIKTEKELYEVFKLKTNCITLRGFKTLEELSREQALSKLLSQQFSHFFNSYAQSFNKLHLRKGSLFMHPYKRKKVSDQNYLLKLVNYIHLNPVESNLCKFPEEWLFSSYNGIIDDTADSLKKKEVLNWFNDKENFIKFHETSLSVSPLTKRL